MITELKAMDFDDFFTSLWGKEKPPFAWQRALVQKVLGETVNPVKDSSTTLHSGQKVVEPPWPHAIELPTASGKTACIDIAIFALAVQAYRLNYRQVITTPRRIFFVVDRRVIVDEAYERASHIGRKLEEAKQGVLKKVADNLRHIARGEATSFENERPLATYMLRGGIYRSEAWARNPLQPTMVASTIDQIGSRILFRAYGRGHGTWPIYAGLIANDSIIFLDEVHCAQPFLQTLRAIQQFQSWGHDPLGHSFHFVVMSATPPSETGNRFRDQSDEPRNPKHPLGMRQLAHKPAILKIAKKAKGINGLAKALCSSALELLNEELQTAIIFANRVATARETYNILSDQENINTVLLTGRMRSLDKNAVVRQKLKPLLQPEQSNGNSLTKPTIIVSTQTLEVGANFDFDGLVTECASLDALRQRFGRLNRMGRDIGARAVILVREDQTDPSKEDPIYGKALAETWKWLVDRKDSKDEVDFGITYLGKTLQGENIDRLNSPTANAPVMLPAHVDCWAQTNPKPYPSPDLHPFLHGQRNGTTDVQVCWRADLDLIDENEETVLELLQLCPPSSNEMLPVPISIFRYWLAGREVVDNSGDVEGVGEENLGNGEKEIDKSSLANEERRIIRWFGAETSQENITSNSAEIRPGDIIVIPANHPEPWNKLGDIPLVDSAKAITTLDMGDRAYRLARAKPILRLHPNLIDTWPDFISAKKIARDLLENNLRQRYNEDPDDVTYSLHNLLTELAKQQSESFPECWSWLPESAKDLIKEYPISKFYNAYKLVGEKSLILIGRRRLQKLANEADSFDEDDDAGTYGSTSNINGQPVKLIDHLCGVEKFARNHASGCGLASDLIESLARAGLLHDIGKADSRFQSLLRGGTPWRGKEFLAKHPSNSVLKTRAARRRAHRASRYPKGGRHELLSVRLAESAPDILPQKDYLRDLVLHLIASHHGCCRPFAPVVPDEQKEKVVYELNGYQMNWSGPTDLELLDSGISERYWKLTRRYGWWGLAWLEALLRLADWRQSDWEENHDEEE